MSAVRIVAGDIRRPHLGREGDVAYGAPVDVERATKVVEHGTYLVLHRQMADGLPRLQRQQGTRKLVHSTRVRARVTSERT